MKAGEITKVGFYWLTGLRDASISIVEIRESGTGELEVRFMGGEVGPVALTNDSFRFFGPIEPPADLN